MAGKRKRHDEAVLARCVARVLAGERAASVAQEAEIPYSTLMTRVTWRKRGQEPVTAATRKKKRPSRSPATGSAASADATAAATAARPSNEAPVELPASAETDLLAWMARLQRARICVRRRDVLDKANGILAALGGTPELGAVWFTRFRERHPEVTGHGTNLVVAEEAVAAINAARAAARGETASPWARVLEPRQQDECVEAATSTTTLAATEATRSAPSDHLVLAASVEPPPPPPPPPVPAQVGGDADELETTPSERAVSLLQTWYGATLAPEDLAEAFDVALDPDKARLLLVLRPGELRDLWIARQVAKRRRAAAAAAATAAAAAVV